MEFRSLWKVQLQRQSAQIPCYSLCFKPDYSQLIVASSNDLFFLDPKTGQIVDQKRSHQAPVYSVRCSYDGAFFASSSSDGTVVIWRSFNNEGFVTYGSQSSARHLVWSPTKQLLISCSAKDSIPFVKNFFRSRSLCPSCKDLFILKLPNIMINYYK